MLMLMLVWAWCPLLLLWRTMLLSGTLSVDQPVLGSIPGWSCAPLPLLVFFVSAIGVISNNSVAHELWKSPTGIEGHAILELRSQAPHEASLLLLLSINLLRCVLCQVIKDLGVILHSPLPLFQSHELFMLPVHNACRNVLSTEGLPKLSPLDLMVGGTSGGIVRPPCSYSYQ